MSEPQRTPGQAEGTEGGVQKAMNEDKQGGDSAGRAQQNEDLDREPGRTPEQAEGTKEQAEGSLHNQQ